jgi:hypothetical protein
VKVGRILTNFGIELILVPLNCVSAVSTCCDFSYFTKSLKKLLQYRFSLTDAPLCGGNLKAGRDQKTPYHVAHFSCNLYLVIAVSALLGASVIMQFTFLSAKPEIPLYSSI